ncbi:MAG TPA: TRAP transporter substrate-binding protein [Pseudolabrys sp.]|nr:TRAP transporter substrate-binding protein [Pseudolabrys sp.]
MQRRTFITGLAGVAGAVAMPHVRRAGAQNPLVIRFAHYVDVQHPGHSAAMQFADRVKQRTNGAVQVNIFPNNALGSPPEELEQCRLGAIDMVIPTQGQLDKYVKAFGACELPFAYLDYEHAHKVLDSDAMMGWLAPLAEQANFIILSNWEYGFRNLTTAKNPINSPDDLKGLKVRTPPEIQISASMEALGGIVTQIAYPELYLALSQGVVDAEENPIATIYFAKFYEVQKHLALTKHIYNNMIQTMSVRSWAKLSKEQQTIFREESKSAGDKMRQLIVSQEDDQVKKLEGMGMKVTRPDLAPFKAKMQPAYAKIGSFAGADNVKKVLDIVAKVG